MPSLTTAAAPRVTRNQAQQIGVRRIEQTVLAGAINDMDRWISELPDVSPWRAAFLIGRRELVAAAGVSPLQSV